jgi:hypothetical protein
MAIKLQNCTNCKTDFPISPLFQQILQKLKAPQPTICANCSHQQKLAFRKDFIYHKAKCALTGKDLITVYNPNLPYKIAHSEAWFSDAYNPLEYGRDVDFSNPFFPQLHQLAKDVPHPHMVIINSQNCDYTNFTHEGKNCYLSARTAGEDIYYSYLTIKGNKVFDAYNTFSCELCYECMDCSNCYSCKWCEYCKNCSNVQFSYDLIGCQNCFGCVGLRNTKYYIFNKPYSKEEYEQKIKEIDTSSQKNVQTYLQQLCELRQQVSTRTDYNLNNDNASGNYITNSKNIENSVETEKSEDVVDTWGAEYAKDIARSDFMYYGELTFENISNAHSQNIQFTYGAYDSYNVEYSMLIYNGSHDVFGSVCLKHNEYIILNKQYSEEDYTHLRTKLIEHMKSTGEYGKFFPPYMAIFPYNESAAQTYFPHTKEQAQEKGYPWKDEDITSPQVEKIIPAERLPDSLNDIPDDILNWAIECKKTKKPFRIIPQELMFYRKQNIPIPLLSPLERYNNRIHQRSPRV